MTKFYRSEHDYDLFLSHFREDNKLIADFMAKSNDSQDITSLKRLFYQRVLDINNKLGLKSMFWEEILETGLPLNKDTVIQVWKVESTYTIQPVS